MPTRAPKASPCTAIAYDVSYHACMVRRTPGTRIANSRDETIYTPPEGEAWWTGGC